MGTRNTRRFLLGSGAAALAAAMLSRLPGRMAAEHAGSASGTPAPADGTPASASPDATPEGPEAMKIQLVFANTTLTATMNESAAARDFLAMLPLTLTLQDYAGTEKISDLPGRLSTEDSPAGFDPSPGDITYYAPWGNLAVFYRDFGYSSGLIHLGTMDGGIEHLETADAHEVTIDFIR